MVTKVVDPFPVISDLDGTPLESGYVYIGDPGLNAEAFPKAAFWDEGLTTPATQPVRTLAGRFVDLGAQIGSLYVDGDYSIIIKDVNMVTVLSADSAADIFGVATFDSIADAEAAIIPDATIVVWVETGGVVRGFEENDTIVCFTDAGGRNFGPLGSATPEHFGADAGSSDNTTALNDWATAVSAGAHGVIRGVFNHSSQFVMPQGDEIIIDGYGGTLRYNGVSTTLNPIWRFGESGSASAKFRLAGLRFASATTMTAGDGVLFERVNRSSFQDMIVDGQDGSGRLYNGVWFKNCDTVLWQGFDARSQNDNIIFSGTSGIGNAEYRLRNGRSIGAGRAGLHLAGGVGGVYIDGDFIASQENLRISTERSAEANRELFMLSGAVFDSSKEGGYSVNVIDTLSGNASFLHFSNPWISAGDIACLRIAPSVEMTVSLDSGTVRNAGVNFAGAGHNILCESSDVYLQIDGTLIRNAVGTGINLTAPNPNYIATDVIFLGNGTNFSTNGRPQSTRGNTVHNIDQTLRLGFLGAEGGELQIEGPDGSIKGVVDVNDLNNLRLRNFANTASVSVNDDGTLDLRGDATFDKRLSGRINLGSSALTIAGGSVTMPAGVSYATIDTQGGAATDDLTDIVGGIKGDMIFIESTNAARVVVVKDDAGTGTSNIMCTGSVDLPLNHQHDKCQLIHDGIRWYANLWNVT